MSNWLLVADLLKIIDLLMIVAFLYWFIRRIIRNRRLQKLDRRVSKLEQQGNYTQAIIVAQQLLKLARQLCGNEHPDVAASMNNLAVLYRSQGRYTEAEPWYRDALAMTKRLLGEEHPSVATSMNNLALLYESQGRYTEAEPLYRDALAMTKRLLGEEHPDVATSMNNLAGLYEYQGRYKEAEPLYRDALAMTKRLLGDEHPVVATSMNNLAGLLAATNHPNEALNLMLEAAEVENRIIRRVFATSSESQRLTYIQTIRKKFELFLSLVFKHLSNSPQAVQAALDLVLKRKSLTAAAQTAQNQAIYSGRYPLLIEQFQQLRSLSEQIVHLTYSTPAPEELTATKQELTELKTKFDDLERLLASQVPEIKLSDRVVDRTAVALELPEGSTLVEFVRFDVFDFIGQQWQPARYLAFILPAQQPDAVQMIDLGEAEHIDRLIRVFRHSASLDGDNLGIRLDMVSDTEPELTIFQYNSVAGLELRDALFAPISPYLENQQHLFISPEGQLNLVPFQILPSDETGERMLMDKYSISYLSAGRDILRSTVDTKRLPSQPLVLADPNFDRVKVEGAKALTTNLHQVGGDELSPQGAKTLTTNFQLLNTLAGNRFERAPGTRFLGESVAQMLDIKPLLGEEALESSLTNSKCPRILLIATHGYFAREQEKNHTPTQKPKHENFDSRLSGAKVENPMLRSGLALAGANIWLKGGKLPPEAGKGMVFAQDVAGLDLWANELTVLSACNTAVGDIKIGEGVFGLRRAFAVAGAKTLVMSLWPVPDKATALLMERFFTNLQAGLGRAEALQDAQNYIRRITVGELRQSALGLEVLKDLVGGEDISPDTSLSCQESDVLRTASLRPLEHPDFWGAWVCQGDTSALPKLL